MNKFIVVVVVLLVLCNVFCYYTFLRDGNLKPQDTNEEYLHYLRKQFLRTENKYEGLLFPSNVSCGSDTVIVDLSKIIVKPTLVYYFSGNTCPPCLESVKDSIEKQFPDYQDRIDILFMSGDLETRLYKNYLGKKIIRVYNEKNKLFTDSPFAPMLFIMDSDLKIQHLFVTDKQTLDLTSIYLNTIKQRYFN